MLPQDPSMPQKKLLLVEDDDALASVYVARLEAEGFSIQRVPNGEEALAKALEFRPDDQHHERHDDGETELGTSSNGIPQAAQFQPDKARAVPLRHGKSWHGFGEAHGRGAEIRQDDGVRPSVEPSQPGHELSQARQGQGQELLVIAGQQRHPADRAQDGGEPFALLRRPS